MVICKRPSISIFFVFLFSILGSHLNAQTTITGCVTDSLNSPIPFATVYLSNTTIGALANSGGNYSITIPQEGVYELITSCIGYKSNTKTIHTEGKNLIINTKLRTNRILIDEISVAARDKNRIKSYVLFLKLFLGESGNAQSCNILNLEDLRLYHDAQDNIAKGYSVKPLRIENKALGYLVTYDLTDFSYNLKTKILKFSGSQYFKPLTGTSKKIEKWERNRLTTFYGSKMHLFRALCSDSLNRESYKIYECTVNSGTDEFTIVKSLQAKDIRVSSDKNSSVFFYNKPLLISYTENHPALSTGLSGFQPKEFKSTIMFSKPLKVYKNGRFDNPYAITWGGKMADERISDMIPFDFFPYVKMKEEPVKNTFTSKIDKFISFRQKSECKDQVFVHTDRNSYAPGDTIFFQAYIRNRFTGEFESGSVSMYAMLYNAQKEIVDSSRFKIEDAASSGWMTIPINARNGNYHFAAFTSMMQNFDTAEAFHLDLSVDGIDDNPTKGEIAAMVPGSTPDDQYPDLKFLPEGGTLVAGLEQRIGFNATNRKGEPVKIDGVLMSADGKVIDTIHSGTYGPGLFVCTPERGMYVELSNGGNNEKKWPLPDPINSGMCLSVIPIDNRSFAMEVQSTNSIGDSAYLVATLNMTQFFSEEFTLIKKQRFAVETDQLPSGVAQITLFNKEMRPVAERLIYINADKHLKYSIQPNSESESPEKETELTISVTDDLGNPSEGVFSIAIVDSLSGHSAELFTPGIEYTLNYHPYLLRNLPVKVLAKGIENLKPEDRDLLMMVYGWKKFNWDFSLMKEINHKELTNYDILNMKISYASKNKQADRKLDLFSMEGPSIMHLRTDKNGEIALPLDSLSKVTRTVIMTPEDKMKVKEANLSISSNQQYFKSIKLFTPEPILLSNFNSLLTSHSETKLSLSDTTIEMQEVTVADRRKSAIKYHDNYEKLYKNSNVKSLDIKPLTESSDLTTALYKITTPEIIGNKVYLRVNTSFFGPRVPALFVLDGLPLYNEDAYELVKKILPSDIASLTVLKGSQGWALYGEQAKGGVIFVNTKAKNQISPNLQTERRSNNSMNQMLLPINLYRSNIEFYNPTKTEVDLNPQLQSSSTIFWKSDIYYDEKVPIKIRYANPKNAKQNGGVIITINGVSSGNMVGTGRASYLVHEDKAH